MSSLVQPKWTSSVRCSPAPTMPSRRRLTKYSTALTSWTVSRSISASSATSSGPKSSTTWRSRDCSSTVRLRTPGHDARAGEVDQPLDLDPDALTVERRLGEVVDERRHGRPVAPVEGTESNGRGRVRERGHGPDSPRPPTLLLPPSVRPRPTARGQPPLRPTSCQWLGIGGSGWPGFAGQRARSGYGAAGFRPRRPWGRRWVGPGSPRRRPPRTPARPPPPTPAGPARR